MIEKKHLTKAQKNAHIIGVALLIIIFAPSFPNSFGRSLLPSIITLCTYSILILYLFFTQKILLKVNIVLFWIIQYLFLLGTALLSEERTLIYDITEIFIPLNGILISLYFYNILKNYNDNEILKTNQIIYKYIYVCIIIIALISIFEFKNIDIELLYLLYKPYEKYLGSSRVVTFFLYPYYMTFFLVTALCFILPVVSYKKNVSSLFLLFLTLSSIIMAQSQSGFVSAIIMVFLYFFIKNPNYINLIIKIIILSLIALCSVFYIPIIIEWLASNYDLYTFRAMNRIINAPETSGTLNIRTIQIEEAFKGSYDNYFIFGSGWGRNIYLESWPAYLIHKYGLLYTILLIIGWAYLIYKLFIKYRFYYREKSILSYYLKSFIIFLAVLPISLSSAFLIFTHKLTILFYLIIMISLHTINKDREE